MRNPYLIGKNVYLRPVESEDAALIAPWFNDPEVNHFLRRCAPMTTADEIDYFEKMRGSETDLILAIMVREGDRFIGLVALHNIDARNRHASVGINIGDKDYWSKGHGYEAMSLIVRHAFQTLNLNRLWLEVYEYNPRAIHVYEKLGFRVEGRLRQDEFRNGRYWDTIVMGVLREELESVDY